MTFKIDQLYFKLKKKSSKIWFAFVVMKFKGRNAASASIFFIKKTINKTNNAKPKKIEEDAGKINK